MARPICGTLFVPSFTPTGNPGEYTFEPSEFVNQSDATGNAAYDTKVGDILFIAATDVNTGMMVPGTVHRYKITQLNVIDATFVTGTMVWDEPGVEVDAPSNGSFCLYAESTTVHRFGIPPSDMVYAALPLGSSVAALALDLRNISDVDIPAPGSLGGGGSTVITATATTTDDTPTKLAVGSTQYIALQIDSSYVFTVKVIGRKTDNSGEECSFMFNGMIRRDSSGTTTILGGVLKSIFAKSNPAWNSEVGADNVNGGLFITVVGSIGSTLSWTATIDLAKSN